MGGTRQRFPYRVCGFGEHVEWKIVDFLEDLDDVQVCNWCGVVSAKAAVLSCLHLVCEECHAIAYAEVAPVCWIDQQTLSSKQELAKSPLNNTLHYKKVRCLKADSGCDYTGSISDLNEHLRWSCDFYFKECSRCERAVVLKDFVSHYKACKGLEGVFVRGVDVLSLIDDIKNTRRELEQVSALTTSEVGDAVALLTDQLETLQVQLTNSECRLGNVPLDERDQ